MTELSGGEIGGIVIGSLIGGVIVIGLILYLLRKWLRGPTKGSDVNVNLDNKVVVITGKNFNKSLSRKELFCKNKVTKSAFGTEQISKSYSRLQYRDRQNNSTWDF